jgi:hypothetical protein
MMPAWGALLGLSINAEYARFFVGAIEVLTVYQFLTGYKKSAASIGLIIMVFALASHVLLGDAPDTYMAPGVAAAACAFVIQSNERSTEDKEN